MLYVVMVFMQSRSSNSLSVNDYFIWLVREMGTRSVRMGTMVGERLVIYSLLV